MTTAYLSRVLQMLFQPLQGTFSSGSILVRSTSETTIRLQPGAVLCPVQTGAESDAACVKVEPDGPQRYWEIPPDGALVNVTSLQGGAHVNLPAGTPLRFDVPPVGLDEVAVVAGDGLAGGIRKEAMGALRQVRAYKDLGGQVDAKQLFAACVGDYPAVVLTWAATTPGDGSVSPSLGTDGTRAGNGKRIYAHEWQAFVICSRLDSSDRRKREGDVLRDDILDMISDRIGYRGIQLSTPSGIKILDARNVVSNAQVYVDAIRFSTWYVQTRRDERTFNDWLTTRMDAPSLQGGDRPTLDNVRFTMR